MEENYPQISESKRIGRVAEFVFEQKFPKYDFNLIKTPEEHDFGVDYRIEPFESGKLLKGYEFSVQLKGFSAIEGHRQSINLRAKTSTLNYLSTKVTPVLIFIVDCETKYCYFDWLSNILEAVKSTKTQTIKISTNNRVMDYFHQTIYSYLKSYYDDFYASLRDDRINAFYQKLFYSSINMSLVIQRTFQAVLYSTDRQENGYPTELDQYLRIFSMAFSKSVDSFRSYNLKLHNDPFNRKVSLLVGRILEIYDETSMVVTTLPGYRVTLTKSNEEILHSINELSSIFIELNRFFSSHFLNRKE